VKNKINVFQFSALHTQVIKIIIETRALETKRNKIVDLSECFLPSSNMLKTWHRFDLLSDKLTRFRRLFFKALKWVILASRFKS